MSDLVLLFIFSYISFKSATLINEAEFQLIGQDIILKGQPIFHRNVSSITECHLLCLQEHEHKKCRSINLENISNDKLRCYLFEVKKNPKTDNEEFEASSNSSYYVIEGKAEENVEDDCQAWKAKGFTEDGIYQIRIQDQATKAFCKMTMDEKAWLVIQRRNGGLTDFNQNWDKYKEGFGDLQHDFWYGNEKIHQLTKNKPNGMMIKIIITDTRRFVKSALYENFTIAGEEENYKANKDLVFKAGSSGFQKIANMMFSTKDRENDFQKDKHCALELEGGWWYSGYNCGDVLINGKNWTNTQNDGIRWLHKFPIDQQTKETILLIKDSS